MVFYIEHTSIVKYRGERNSFSIFMNASEKSRSTLCETFYLNMTVNVFYFLFYLNLLLPKCIHHSIFHCPLISALESVLYYMNVPCDQHKEFTSAARTPVTNHVFHCSLPFSLIMSNRAQNTPTHHHHLDTLCWEKWLLFMLFIAVAPTMEIWKAEASGCWRFAIVIWSDQKTFLITNNPLNLCMIFRIQPFDYSELTLVWLKLSLSLFTQSTN